MDKRADIWSFGVVLYEMLAGKRLFEGETVSDILAAVLTREPGWSALPSTTPGASVRLLRRCLERDPRQRLRDIGEARIALESTSTHEDVEPVTAPARGYRGLVMAMAMAALALTAAGVVVGSWLGESTRVVRKLDITDVQMRTGSTLAPVLSPNGERVLYFTQAGLRVRELDRAEARTLVDSDGIASAFWSPDGREIGFFKEGGLYRMSLDGGAPQLIAQTGPAVSGAGATWGTDGRIVYALGNTSLFEVSARGGEPRVMLEADAARREDHFHGGSFLPGGRAFVFVVHQLDTPTSALAVLEGGRSLVLLELESEGVSQPVFSPSGHIVFSTRGAGQDGVWALPFSLSRLEATGEPFLIAPGASSPSVAADGSLLYVPARPPQPVPLIWVSRSGQREGTAVEFPGDLVGIALSRDGKRVAAAVGDALGSDIWIADLERGSRTRLTVGAQGPTTARAPAWSPDGARIAFHDRNRFSAVRGGSIWVVPADGSGEPRVVGSGLQPFFGADGRTILAHRTHVESRRTLYEIVSFDAAGESEPRVVLTDSVSVRFPLLSPDGRFLAYDRGDGEEVDSFLTRFPGVEGRWQVSATRGTFLRWSPDGRRLFYFGPTPGGTGEGLFEVEVEVGQDGAPSLGIPSFLFALSSVGAAAEEYEVGPGDRFLMTAREEGDSFGHLVFVENWSAELQ